MIVQTIVFFVGDVCGFRPELVELEFIDTNRGIELFHRSAEIKRKNIWVRIFPRLFFHSVPILIRESRHRAKP